MEAIIARRDKPAMISSDSGTERTSRALSCTHRHSWIGAVMRASAKRHQLLQHACEMCMAGQYASFIRSGRGFLRALADQFDLVFLDTPPLMAVSDSRVTAQLADYIVFLIRWETRPRELAVNALRLLKDLRKHVGVVMSQVNVRRHAKYGYGDCGYYYSKYRNYYTE